MRELEVLPSLELFNSTAVELAEVHFCQGGNHLELGLGVQNSRCLDTPGEGAAKDGIHGGVLVFLLQGDKLLDAFGG